MVKIRLFCASGMSTSILVNKMREAAKNSGVEADIAAFAENELEKRIEDVDVALLGPQVAYTLPKVKEICDKHNVNVDVIPIQYYGMMDGKATLDFAMKLLKK